ncbi:hypothetical protein UVI_02012390 [Ustilaginoidea virens]|uniref:Uncharacterized protein n=1 Tax=Ustilaginoidea virens TaxID=1159556 RepID=A0A1B5L5V7_USTVR|nr:hypothetical protein UVI_02012390 [Ustilaginoidea virens]
MEHVVRHLFAVLELKAKETGCKVIWTMVWARSTSRGCREGHKGQPEVLRDSEDSSFVLLRFGPCFG